MRTSTIRGLAPILPLALALLASPAFAQDDAASETDPPPAITVTGGATLVSDYRFRGISQTDKEFAIQGTFTIAHESGLYGTVWASSIDDYIAAGGDAEIDLTVGFRKEVASGTTLDIGLLYYYYPGAEDIIPGYDSDFFEPFVAVTHVIGPVTGKLTAAYAWEQSGLSIGNGKEDNLYIAGDLSAGLPGTPISLTAHLGHSFGPSYLTIGDEYTDWSLGASVTWKSLTLGVSYVDTDGSFINPISGKNVSKAGVVASLGVTF